MINFASFFVMQLNPVLFTAAYEWVVVVVVVKVYLPTAIERFDIQARIFILHHALIRLCCLACLLFTSHTTNSPKYDPHWNGGCMCFGARKIIESVSVCVCVCSISNIYGHNIHIEFTHLYTTASDMENGEFARDIYKQRCEYEFVCANILVEHSSSVISCEYCQS